MCGGCKAECAVGKPSLFPNEFNKVYEKSNMSHGAPEVPSHFIAMGQAMVFMQGIGSAARRNEWDKASHLAQNLSQNLNQGILDETFDYEGFEGIFGQL